MSAMVSDELLGTPFPAAMTKDAVHQMRESLDVAKNTNLVAFYGFAAMNRDEMVQMLRSVVADDGAEEAYQLLPALAAVVENLRRIAAMASMVEARAILAMHVALDISTAETMPDADADEIAQSTWDAAVGDVERHLGRLEALPDGYTDAEANEIAADLGPALDHMTGTPAPNLPALLKKFEILWGAEDEFTRHPDAMDVRMVAKDIRRLAAAAS